MLATKALPEQELEDQDALKELKERFGLADTETQESIVQAGKAINVVVDALTSGPSALLDPKGPCRTALAAAVRSESIESQPTKGTLSSLENLLFF